MPRSVAPGATDQSEYFYIVQDVGGSAPGEPKTGLTHSDITSAYYTRTRAAAVQVASLSTLAAANTTHTDGGFKEVDGTNQPGVYRFDPPDAAYAANAVEVVIGLNVAGAANAVARPVKVMLDNGSGLTEAGGTGDQFTAISVAIGGITAGSFAAGAIDAAATSADFIAEINATVDTALSDIKLDHLVAVADADDAVDNSIIAKLASKSATADWSSYVNTTDSQEALRDHIGDGTALTEAGGTGDHLTALALSSAGVDAIWDELMAELTTDPGATPKMREIAALLYMKHKNAETSTATAATIKNNAGTTVLTSTLSDDATTFTKGKYS